MCSLNDSMSQINEIIYMRKVMPPRLPNVDYPKMFKEYSHVILVAGVGARLYPYTKNSPKCLVKVTECETVIERCLCLTKKYDNDAHVTVVLGFQYQRIIDILKDKCDYIVNPFYKVTNSIASLWFARNILKRRNLPS